MPSSDIPALTGPAERAAYAEQLRKEVAEALHDHVVAEFAASTDARDPGRPAPSLPHIGDVPADPELILTLTTARAALEGADASVVLRAAGHEWELHPSVRPALEALVSGAHLTLGDLAERSGLTVEQVAALATELVSKDAAAEQPVIVHPYDADAWGEVYQGTRHMVEDPFCYSSKGCALHDQ